MSMPDIQKGGKAAREHAANLRRKVKRGKELNADERTWLDAWEARVSTMPPGRPKGSGKQDDDSQPAPEKDAGGGADKPDPASPSPEGSAPPAEPEPPLEGAPRVAPVATPQAAQGGDWRAEHRKRVNFTGDGRQMLCEGLADAWAEAMGALVDDMKKADIKPMAGLDPRLPQLKSLAVLAFDEIIPERVKLSPKVGFLVVTTATIGKRAYHHKAITEALKTDPETIAWKKRQAEREAADLANKAAHDAEVAAAKKATEPKVEYAAPPPPKEPERPVNGTAFNANKQPVAGGYNDDGKGMLL